PRLSLHARAVSPDVAAAAARPRRPGAVDPDPRQPGPARRRHRGAGGVAAPPRRVRLVCGNLWLLSGRLHHPDARHHGGDGLRVGRGGGFSLRCGRPPPCPPPEGEGIEQSPCPLPEREEIEQSPCPPPEREGIEQSPCPPPERDRIEPS